MVNRGQLANSNRKKQIIRNFYDKLTSDIRQYSIRIS